jgi:hypothetical protein
MYASKLFYCKKKGNGLVAAIMRLSHRLKLAGHHAPQSLPQVLRKNQMSKIYIA